MLKLTQSTYKINNFFWISRSNFYSLSYHTPFPIAKGTKLQCTIEFPSPITHDGTYAGAKGKDGDYYWFTNGTDYVIKDGKMVINTTVNTTYDWTTLIGSFPTQGRGTVSSDGSGVGSINFENVSFVGDGPISVQNDWTLTNSVGKVIKKTNEIKNTSVSYGTFNADGVYRPRGFGDLASKNNSGIVAVDFTADKYSGADSFSMGIYPIYNLINDSSGFAESNIPNGSSEPGIDNWHPTFSTTEYNPITGSKAIDVSSQSSQIDLFYNIPYGGNTWNNGMIISFFVKLSSNKYGTNFPINLIKVNLNTYLIKAGQKQQDQGVTALNAPDPVSNLDGEWRAGTWCEVAFIIKDFSSLPSRNLSGIGFTLLTDTNSIQYFSDPGVYPNSYVSAMEPGFLATSV